MCASCRNDYHVPDVLLDYPRFDPKLLFELPKLVTVEEDAVGGELNSDVVGKMEVELAKLQHWSDK